MGLALPNEVVGAVFDVDDDDDDEDKVVEVNGDEADEDDEEDNDEDVVAWCCRFETIAIRLSLLLLVPSQCCCSCDTITKFQKSYRYN